MRFGTSLSLTQPRGLRFPALDLDLTKGALPANVNFTRASTATYFGSNGLLQTASSGAPRFTYDPATLTPLGLLIEESRTNLLRQSNQFDTTWAASGTGTAAIAGAAGTSPDGSNNAWKLTENSTTLGAHTLSQTGNTVTSGVAETVSVFAKAAERSQIQVQYFDGTANGIAIFSLTDGSVVSSSGTTATTSQKIGSGWWRLSVTATSAGTNGQMFIYPALGGTNSYAGTIGSGVLIYGAQLEQAAFPTSYIPTTTASVTRSADVATMTLASIGIPANPAGLTIIAKAQASPGAQTNANYLVQLDDGTANNRINILRTSGRSLLTGTVVAGVAQSALNLNATLADGAAASLWFAQQASDYAGQQIGQTKQTSASGSLPTGMTTLRIGGRETAGFNWNAPIARLQIYNGRKPDAQAAAIAASL